MGRERRELEGVRGSVEDWDVISHELQTRAVERRLPPSTRSCTGKIIWEVNLHHLCPVPPQGFSTVQPLSSLPPHLELGLL